MLRDRQQKMLIYMYRFDTISRQEQPFYITPFFYMQMGFLIKKNLVIKKWDTETGNAQYLLTPKGNQIAEVLNEIYKDVEL